MVSECWFHELSYRNLDLATIYFQHGGATTPTGGSQALEGISWHII